MSFSFRDKGRLGDRLRGKTCDEIIKELRDHLHLDRGMSFDSPSWGGFSSSPAFARAGFPFMDQDMMSGPDMRAHFEDLASRHPEFAEHLRPAAWNTVPETDPHFFHGASGPNLYRQRHSSGGSGSGSYGEGEAVPIPVIHEDSGGGETTTSRSRTRKIPQYGMRNTVDLGESQKSTTVDGSEGDSRSQRSWSAPPDNRTQSEAPQPKRFVTKVEVNNGPTNPANGGETEAPPAPSATNISSPGGKPPPFPKSTGVGPTPQSTAKQGNVRHIPIFVEGRDEPILPKSHEGQSFSSSHSSSGFGQPSDGQSFSSSHSSSGFGQPNSSFSYSSASPGSHSSSFASSHSPSGSTRSHSSAPHPQASGPFSRAGGPFSHPSAPHPHPSAPHPHPSAPHPQTSAPHPQASAPMKPKHETPPPQPQPPKPAPPKDPIARVKAIQEEVNEFKKRVENFSGSRSDKEYIYLDEMLTRNLLKLDDIETEGKDNIRQARKEAIRSIEKFISLLESKAPLPQESNGAEHSQAADVMNENSGTDDCVEMSQEETAARGVANDVPSEVMEVQQKLDTEGPRNLEAAGSEGKSKESSPSETPMEVAPEVGTEKGKEDCIPSTSEQVNPEGMEVVSDSNRGSQDAASPGHEVVKTEVQMVGGESGDKVAVETASTNGVNTNCDVKTEAANGNVNEGNDAGSTVTEGNVNESGTLKTEQGNGTCVEPIAVVKGVVNESDSNEPVKAQNESVETSKNGALADNESIKNTNTPNVSDVPPVEVANKEMSS